MKLLPGQSYPLGSVVRDGGVNFCLYSKTATAVDLLLFDHGDAIHPSQVISLDPKEHRTSHYWHAFIEGLNTGQVYAYRVDGPHHPEKGHRFDPNKVLLDPYTRTVVGWEHYSREAAIRLGDNCAQALRSVVVDTRTYDWQGDSHPRIPYAKTIIYELHVDAFTHHPNSGVSLEKRGTYAGLIEKIPYLQDLGITAIELMPIHQFDPQDAHIGLENYWGYSTMAFFAPHRAYSSRTDLLGPIDEFRDLVKALHQAGIEVILDVVFNHTAESNHEGPTLSFKGLENSVYYILEDNPIYYRNYSGCGNSVKANHPVVGKLILDCLHFWVADMHVDGFRFDLASVLARDASGSPVADPPILWTIDSDPILAGTKIIAEAWDAVGLYQVGSFIGDRFAEWNGPFRDDVRRFVTGQDRTVPQLANRMLGSPDMYGSFAQGPNRSINFITCHDGFTLNDLVTYNTKNNQANGEDNRDGSNQNYSWNCGIEGPTDDPVIEALRLRQIKNYFVLLFFSQGTPMLLMGDEVRRTQLGNNNAYCQNNVVSWLDWSLLDQHTDLLRFVKAVIRFTQSLFLFQQDRFLAEIPGLKPRVIWHGIHLGQPDWQDHSHSLSFTLQHPNGELLHGIFNAYWDVLSFELLPLPVDQAWYCIINTAHASPSDFVELPHALPVLETTYTVAGHSTVILMASHR